MPPIKKIIGWLVFAFLIYAVVTSPASAATILGSTWDVILTGLRNIGAFFNALLHRG